MLRAPPRVNRPATRLPYTTLFRASSRHGHGQDASMAPRRRRDTRKGLAAGPACLGHRPGLLLTATVLACLSAPLHAQSRPFSGEVALSSQLVRSEEPTSELPSLMRIPYAVFCLSITNNNKFN